MNYQYYLLFNIILIFTIVKVYTKEYIIRNEEEGFINLRPLFPNFVGNELILNFVDDYYNVPISKSRYEITVASNITFRGNQNGTIMDYGYSRNYELGILHRYSNTYTVTFENFIFQNYNEELDRSGMELIRFISSNDNFYLKFINCTFLNNSYSVVRIEETCPNSSHFDHSNPSVVFDNCYFL